MAGELRLWRWGDDGIGAVFGSDLARAAETAAIAFGATGIPVLLDVAAARVRLRTDNGMPSGELRRACATTWMSLYPGGESWRQAVDRVGPYRWPTCRCAGTASGSL